MPGTSRILLQNYRNSQYLRLFVFVFEKLEFEPNQGDFFYHILKPK